MKSWLKAKSKRAAFPLIPRFGFFGPLFKRVFLQALINETVDEITDKRPILLLWAMQSYLYIDREYRRRTLPISKGSTFSV